MIKRIVDYFSPPKRFFSSDFHFSHRNVILYCNRPYKDVEEMNNDLIKIWNRTIRKKDTVYVIGDFSLNPKVSAKIIPLLNGNKILIPGNHDSCFLFPAKENTKHAIEGAERRHKKMCERYLQDGWKSIHQTLTIQLKSGHNVLLSHLSYAPKSEEKFDTRYMNLRPKDEGLFLLHGHEHVRYRKNGRRIDVGIDGDFKIWSEDEIIEMIKDERDVIESPLKEWYSNREKKTEMKGEGV